MPTLAQRDRADLTRRAIRSVVGQRGVHAIPLLVVNGSAPDPEFLAELEADPQVQVVRDPNPGLPGALHRGRLSVATPWFSALDDDDLLLEGSLAARVDVLEAHPGLDVVVGNGIRRTDGTDVVHWSDIEALRHDLLEAMTHANWLLPGAWLARSERVRARAFSRIPGGGECTYLGLYFAVHHPMGLVDRPVVVWNTDTPDSLSKGRGHILAQTRALGRILELDLPAPVRARFVHKMTEALHSASDACRRDGDLGEAWRWHLRTLVRPGGWRHLAYSRHLLTSLLAR